MYSTFLCFSASMIIQREDPDEDYLVVYKQVPGHTCDKSFVVIQIIMWRGIDEKYGDYSYSQITHLVGNYGKIIPRACRQNKAKNCKCQGKILAQYL